MSANAVAIGFALIRFERYQVSAFNKYKNL